MSPQGALYESSTEAEEWLIGPFGGSVYSDQQAAPSLFPWGDGFLQIGYLNTSEQVPSEMNLFAQTSDDGLNWEQPFQVNLPREHFEALETDIDSSVITSWPIIRSNGEHLVVLSQLPGRHFGDRGPALFLAGDPLLLAHISSKEYSFLSPMILKVGTTMSTLCCHLMVFMNL